MQGSLDQLDRLVASLPEVLQGPARALLENPWIQAVLLALLFLLAAQLVVLIFIRWLGNLARRTQTAFDDQLLLRLRRPVFVSVFLFGLGLATRRLPLPAVFGSTTIRLLQTFTLLVWLGFALAILGDLLRLLSRGKRTASWIEPRTIPLFDNLGKVLLVAAAGYGLCLVWDVDATAWLTSAGIVGIALGFAAKDTLANIFSGIFILADAPYQIGDFVMLDSGERGRVTQIGLRSTRLLTRDDIEIVIPNSVIANAKIVNETGGPHEKERVRIAVGVAYGSDADHVVEVLQQTAAAADGICREPEPRVRFRRFGESSLDFELLCWIEEPIHRGRMVHELNMAVYKAFAREGIVIPFPQRDVHLDGQLDRHLDGPSAGHLEGHREGHREDRPPARGEA